MTKQLKEGRGWMPVLAASLVITAVTSLVFYGLYWHPFFPPDDSIYVTNNLMVRKGPTYEVFEWAVTSLTYGNWSPLTWLSHALDWQLFGKWAGGHHLVSLGIHLANSLLFFALLFILTDSPGKSLLCAVLFAIHPLHVEPVAWISSRKDLLAGFFSLWALLCYVRYARKGSFWFYLLTFFFLFFALASKSSAVCLPFVFLALDWWPLERLGNHPRCWHLRGLEKIPFLLLAGVFIYLTILGQTYLGATDQRPSEPLLDRLLNASFYLWTYGLRILAPFRLAVPYPFTEIPLWKQLSATLLSLAAVALILRHSRTNPSLFAGSLWFLSGIFPYLQFTAVGVQPMADRFTYFPAAGAFVALVWGVDAALKRFNWRLIPHAVAAAVVAICILTSLKQLSYWEQPFRLYERALELYPHNPIALSWMGNDYRWAGNAAKAAEVTERGYEQEYTAAAFSALGRVYETQGRSEELVHKLRITVSSDERYSLNEAASFYSIISFFPKARRFYKETYNRNSVDEGHRFADAALRLNPNDVRALTTKGMLYFSDSKLDEAIPLLERVVALNPYSYIVLHNLGVAYARKGRIDEGINALEQAVRYGPASVDTFIDLAKVLIKQGNQEKAHEVIERTLLVEPLNSKAWTYKGSLLLELELYRDAIPIFERALSINAENIGAMEGLGAALFKTRQANKAEEIFRRALRIKPESAVLHLNLASVLIATGKYEEGRAAVEKALEIQPGMPEALEVLGGFKKP